VGKKDQVIYIFCGYNLIIPRICTTTYT